MKHALLLLLVLHFVGGSVHAGELENAEKAVKKAAKMVRPAVVTVITPNERDFDLTGVVIAPGVVLTVRTPLLQSGRLPPKVPVRFPGKGATIRAELIDSDTATNTVLYRAAGSRTRPLSTARAEDVSHGMWVLLVGNAFGQGRESMPTLSLGVISGVQRERDAITAFHTSAMVNPGSFGAPIVDLSGDLVGITAPAVTADGQQTIVIPYDRIREAYCAKKEKGARVVGRPQPKRRLRNHIADLLGPVLEDAGRRASGALVAVRAIALPSDGKPPEKKTGTKAEGEKKEEKKKKNGGKRKRPKGPPPPRRVPGAREAWDRSSGVIVDRRGLVLCPLRVTGWPKATRPLIVDLIDGRSVDATVLGTDERLRLALLKISAAPLTPLEPAPKDALRAGHFVVALGYPHTNPAKQTPQLTFGIVSRTEALGNIHPAFRAVQTDAAVSATNRGGPLVDIDGRLVGILLDVNDTDMGGYRSRGRGRFTGNAGLGFAVPWSVLETLIPRLARGETLRPAMLGVRTIETPKGPEIVAVVEKNSAKVATAAHAAGLKKGDVLVSIAGRAVKTTRELRRVLGAFSSGDKAVVIVRRGEKEIQAELLFTGP